MFVKLGVVARVLDALQLERRGRDGVEPAGDGVEVAGRGVVIG